MLVVLVEPWDSLLTVPSEAGLPEVLAGLKRDQRYGIAWYNRTRWERTPDGEKAVRVTPNKQGDWIAVPVPDAGVPREWADAARAATKDNVRSSRADQRSWELKGILFCPCGCRMVPYNSRRGGKRYHYYACGRYRREGPGACEHRKNWPADSLEGAARRYVLALLRDPEVLRRQVRQSLEDEIALRNPESKIRAWAGRLSEVDRVRLAYQRQQARGTREEGAGGGPPSPISTVARDVPRAHARRGGGATARAGARTRRALPCHVH